MSILRHLVPGLWSVTTFPDRRTSLNFFDCWFSNHWFRVLARWAIFCMGRFQSLLNKAIGRLSLCQQIWVVHMTSRCISQPLFERSRYANKFLCVLESILIDIFPMPRELFVPFFSPFDFGRLYTLPYLVGAEDPCLVYLDRLQTLS